ncbi:MAG TPA: biotin-dependent carboxyltransferase family protein [Mycobacteriales bacterium]|nr:biotin-dependent carboxyltransferase family protein [Mycobacteriales bacterium]
MIEILRPGPLATVQDLGRPGYAHLGVGRSGAADRGSLRLANRLVGNPETAAGLEITFGGLTARFLARATIALTGAPVPAMLAGRTTHLYGPVEVSPGDELALGTPIRGVRTYLAVRGGVDVPAVFGSRATDLLGGLGPAALERGTRLPVGTETAGFPTVDVAAVPALPAVLVLPVRAGPRADWFAAGALERLGSAAYEVTPASNRVGVRLDGPALAHAGNGELPTEGMVEGSLQVPPDGRPIVMLADHPVTGGYPVIAVLDDAAIGLAGQARPGDVLRFRVRT